MSRIDPDLHWLQIARSSYHAVNTLIDSGTLRPYAGLLYGPKGTASWQIPADSLRVLSDRQIDLAGQDVYASVSRLPAHVYRALVAGSPTFTQYPGVDDLYHALRSAEPQHAASFTAELEMVAHSERVADPVPRLVSCPITYSAQWIPHATFVRLGQSGDYFLGLSFRAHYRPIAHLRPRTEIGLDLGLAPLTVAYTADGRVTTFELTNLSVLDRLHGLSRRASNLLEQLIYAAGRADGERLIAYLNVHAHTVFAEHLTHRGMSQTFVHRGRAHAVHDHHFSSLPQYLNTSCVEFRRVDPAYTSRICAYCLEKTGQEIPGHRQGRVFTCSTCHRAYDAHVNAAHNVLLRGQRLPPRYQRSG